jgi:hypothetical protein
MCEIKTKKLYKPLKKEAIKEEPKIFSKIVKIKKNPKRILEVAKIEEEVSKFDVADNYIKLMN